MSPEPYEILRMMGIGPAEIVAVDTLSTRHGHLVWRITTPRRSYVLKWLPEEPARSEVGGYLLLRQLGVSTLPLYGHTGQALLLEDLTHSDVWRLATEQDMDEPRVGRAVARWYRTFHEAGEAFLARVSSVPTFLTRETDALDGASILRAAQVLALSDHPVWDLVMAHVALLRAATERLSVTLNYNDFYWTNLALSSQRQGSLEAVVFDYHLLGIGMRYCDCRNVTGSLGKRAAAAFWEVYGPPDPREVVLDRPLATLFGLVAASRLPDIPRWAEACRQQVLDGRLARDVAAAVEVARALV